MLKTIVNIFVETWFSGFFGGGGGGGSSKEQHLFETEIF